MFSRRVTDRRSYGQTDILRQHSPRYAQHRAVKNIYVIFWVMISLSTVISVLIVRRAVSRPQPGFSFGGIALPLPTSPLFTPPSLHHPSRPSPSLLSFLIPFPGAPLPLPARRSGERCKLPQRGPGQSPGRKRILGHFCGSEVEQNLALHSPYVADQTAHCERLTNSAVSSLMTMSSSML